MTIQSLTILRSHARVGRPHLGPVHELSGLTLPEEAPPSNEDELFDALGWREDLPSRAGLDEIAPRGFVEPSSLEFKYLEWLASTLALPLREGWDRSTAGAAHASLREALSPAGKGPWKDATEMPDGVVVRRAATRYGEALGTARAIRRWLADAGVLGMAGAAEACEQVLVLLPSDPSTVDLWARVLAAHDLPVRASYAAPLDETPIARWLFGLARMVGWADHAKRRDTLALVLGGPYWSARAACRSLSSAATAPDDDRRTWLRSILRERLPALRRPEVTCDGWLDHLAGGVEADGKQGADRTLVAELSKALARTLAPGQGLAARLHALVFGGPESTLRLDMPAAVRQMDDEGLNAVVDRLREILLALRYEEEAEGGQLGVLSGDGDPGLLLEAVLRDRLEGRATMRHLTPRHGITLLPYAVYDARSCGLLFLAGLGEGSFPVVPSFPTHEQAQWLERLLGAADPEAWVADEVERQIRLAAHAIGGCTGTVHLSLATEAAGTGLAYPGPLLSLLVGGWSDSYWRGAGQADPRVEDLREADELPADTKEVSAAAQLDAFALGLELPEFADGTTELARRVAGLAARRDQLATTVQAERARNPVDAEDGSVAFGEYTGHLPGKHAHLGPFSPSALERYGKCPAEYLFNRVLRAEEPEDADLQPDALESGSMVHDALFEAAQLAAQTPGEMLSFSYSEEDGDEGRAKIVRQAIERIGPGLQTAVDSLAKVHPSMSPRLLQAIGRRWRQALANWVHDHVTATCDPETDPAKVQVLPDVVECDERIASLAAQLGRLQELIAGFEAGQVTSQKAAAGFAVDRRLPQSALENAYRDASNAVSDKTAPFEALIASVEQSRLKAMESRGALIEQAKQSREQKMARNVTFAELSFGFDERSLGTDPASIVGSVELQVDGEAIPIHGTIDRVDHDPKRKTFAVRDYKTGKRRSAKKICKDILEGRQLQLLLYTLALEQLIADRRLDQIPKAEADRVALEFPKVCQGARKRDSGSEIRLETIRAREMGSDGESVLGAADLARIHIRHHVDGIREARFSLWPVSCPKETGEAYCDYESVCGFRPAMRHKFQTPARRELELIEVDAEKPPKRASTNYPTVVPLASGGEVKDVEKARAEHERAGEAAIDLSRNIFISAGAGTGKTYNLVRRYLAALASGTAPQKILCITFTRRAAAEMAHRVRSALLAPEGGMSPLVEKIRQDAERFRRILLTLSSAPISTIDSLALHIVKEDHRLRAELEDAPQSTPDVADESVLAPFVEALADARYLAEIDGEDPDLQLLLQCISPGHLRPLLRKAALAWPPGREKLSAAEVASQWWRLAEPLAEQIKQDLAAIDPEVLEQKLESAGQEKAKSKQPTPGGVAAVQACISALRALQSGTGTDPRETWRHLASVLCCPTTKGGKVGVGNNDLLACIIESITPIQSLRVPKGSDDAALLGSIRELLDGLDKGGEDPVAEWSKIAAAVASVVSRWSAEISRALTRRGTLRHVDVERLALEVLHDDQRGKALAQRLVLEHIFIDESQDTNRRQVQLVDSLKERTGARTFWVGDVKQSIYRFRQAEVDVFEDLLARAPTRDRVALTISRRSGRRLIESFNRFFGSILPALHSEPPHDERSAMHYEPLVWLEDEDDEVPRIEIIAEPGRRWDLNEDPLEPDDSDDTSDDGEASAPAGTPSECAVVQRIREIVQTTPRTEGPDIALLVHAWSRAQRYRDLLQSYGVPAIVQGGRGLLTTEEAANLMRWLEWSSLGSDVALVGVLRGPGVAMSDAGLYCLRHGHGMRDDQGRPTGRRHLRWSVSNGSFDAVAAVEDWRSVAGTIDETALEILRRDGEALRRFRELDTQLRTDLGRGHVSAGIERLISGAGLAAWWGSRDEPTVRLANLRSFVGLLTEMELAHESVERLVRGLQRITDSDDPAAGGLSTSGPARVVVTTYWQAKGLEWRTVVLPDLQKHRVSMDNAGLSGWRVALPANGGYSILQVPGVRETLDSDPFGVTTPKLVVNLVRPWEMPAERAELRRILYVAMTRAKERLILSACFDRPGNDDALTLGAGNAARKVVTLGQCTNWAKLLLVATDLSFDEAGIPRLGDGVWQVGRDVILHTAESLATKLGDARPTTHGLSGKVDEALLVRLAPVPAEPLAKIKPSEHLMSDAVPEPSWRLGDWPEETGDHESELSARHEGTILHAVLEAWGYETSSAPSVALVEKLLAQRGLAAGARAEELAKQLVVRVESALTTRPDLVDRLRVAAQHGKLLHEVPLSFEMSNGIVSGEIDLMWKDGNGWHILDYKWGNEAPTDDSPLTSKVLRKHHAQVRCYAEGFAAAFPGQVLADYGIWYPAYGLTIGWKA